MHRIYNKEYSKIYYQKHKKERMEYSRKYKKKNREKVLQNLKEYRKSHKEEIKKQKRNHRLLINYGLNEIEYNKLFVKQNGVCAICFEKEKVLIRGKVPPLSVDHDHKTKKVRGLLCSRCNLILGGSNDNIKILENCIKYLIINNK